MRTALVVTLVVVGALGCEEPLRRCMTDDDCTNGVCSRGLCVRRSDGGTGGGDMSTGGGGAGGSSGGVGGGGGMACVPTTTQCPGEYQCGSVDDGCGTPISCGSCPGATACDTSTFTCISQGVGITLVVPARTKASPVPVTATLDTPLGANDPDTLVLASVDSQAMVGPTSTLNKQDAGVYVGEFVPTRDSRWNVIATSPDGGLSSPAKTIDFDTTGPVVTISLTPPPTRTVMSDYTQQDPLDVTEAVSSYRRDELLTFKAKSDDGDLVASSVVMRFADAGVTGGPACADSRWCTDNSASLGAPTMNAARTRFRLEVTAQDDLGNQTTAGVDVPVTRFGWRRTFSSRTFPPAIDADGGIWTSWDQGFVKLNPDGTPATSSLTAWRPNIAPIVSPRTGWAMVWVRTTTTTKGQWLSYAGDGSVAASSTCNYQDQHVDQPALISTMLTGESVARDALVGETERSGGGSAYMYRPQVGTCFGPAGAERIGQPAAAGGFAFGYSSALTAVSLTDTGYTTVPNWPIAGASRPDDTLAVSSSHLFSSGLSPGGTGYAILSYDWATSRTLEWYADLPSGIGAGVLTVGRSDVVYLANGSVVCRAQRGTPSVPLCVPVSGSTAVSIGSDGDLYVGGTSGLSVLDAATLSTKWTLPTANYVDRAVALDCRRQSAGAASGPGRAIFAFGNNLQSVVVDARGLDALSAWPKWRHDNGNTGNASTPIAACP